jgi:hypothetical protein
MNNGNAPDLREFSPRSSACSLREACKKVGRDEGGNGCLNCPVRGLCEDESRWLIKRTGNHRYWMS